MKKKANKKRTNKEKPTWMALLLDSTKQLKKQYPILRKISKNSRRVYFLTILYVASIHDISDKGF